MKPLSIPLGKKVSTPLTPITLITLTLAAPPALQAFPPAPHHEVYGTVRDAKGNPLSQGQLVLSGESGEVLRGPVHPAAAPGANYTLKVPMDAGTLGPLYRPTAMRPGLPFTVKVLLGGAEFVPIEVRGSAPSVGEPSGRTRLDLTLGADTDRDGLPDAWEADLIDADPNDRFATLGDVDPSADADGDGLSNYAEYIAGTYAFDREDGFQLEIVDARDGLARFRFLAVTGRTYTLQSAADARTFSPAAFSLAPGGPAGTSFRAPEVRVQEIYVPVGEALTKTFRLHVR